MRKELEHFYKTHKQKRKGAEVAALVSDKVDCKSKL